MRENKFEKILAAAAHLISKKGYTGTSFQEIANNVGIHKSTLFHYFKNKEDVLLRILERSIEEVYRNLEQITSNDALGPEEKLEKAIHNHLALLLEYFDNVNVYLNEFRSLSEKNQALYLQKRKKYERDFEKIVLEMKKLGYFQAAPPATSPGAMPPEMMQGGQPPAAGETAPAESSDTAANAPAEEATE